MQCSQFFSFGLPFGTRGGMLIKYEFPADGEYTFTVKGVTYGTFARNEEGFRYPDPEVVERDFREMREAGVKRLATPLRELTARRYLFIRAMNPGGCLREHLTSRNKHGP